MEKVASGIMNRKFEPPVVPPEAMSVSELLLEVKFLREAWKSGSAVNTSPFRLLQNMLRSVGQSIICTDKFGNIQYWNPAAVQMYGYSEDEALSKNVVDLLGPAGGIPEDTAIEIMSRLEQGEEWRGEYCVKNRNGEELDIYVVDTPIMSEGVQIGIIGVSTDISALKKKERECVQLNRNLEKIVEQRTRELQEVNQKLEEANVKLREANSLLGKTNQDLSEANNKLKQEVQQHLMAKEELKRTIDCKDELMRELEKAKEHAESASVLKTKFLAHMSHELQTPLNGILGVADLITEEGLSTAQTSHLQTLKDNGKFLLGALVALLDLSKVCAGELILEPNRFNPSEMVNELVSKYQAEAERKGLMLNCFVENSVPAFGLTDNERLVQAIDCLVSNAIKFTETGSVEISVSFTEFSEEDKVNFAASAPLKLSACFEGKEPMGTFQVAVRDTGVGVSPQDIPQLFQPFIQLDASSTRRFGGMGLGLSLSKELAQVLGGKIECISEGQGKGSTFILSAVLFHGLNKRKGSTDSTGIEQISPKKAKVEPKLASVTPTSSSPSKKVKNGHFNNADSNLGKTHPLSILVVEDNRMNWTVASANLKRMGYEADWVTNGLLSVGAVKEKHYDLVLMDIQMPVMDGVEATKNIVEIMGETAPRVVALTANTLESDKKRCLDVGMSAFLKKPLSKEKLKEELIRTFEMKSN